MIVVTGHLTLDPAERERYLAECHQVVLLGRAAPGCLDFALSADLVDPARINVLEVWEVQEQLDRFRGSGPSSDQQAALHEVAVREWDAEAR